MKKIYIAIITLIIIVAGVLTYITKPAQNIPNTDNQTSQDQNIINATSTQNNLPTVAENPEDEDNGNMGPGIFEMDLDTKTWAWISTNYNDGKIIKPNTSDKFKLTFNTKNKTFSASTDCNGIGGEYVLNGNKITFEKMMSTLMYCEGSQEGEFSKALSQISSYRFTNKGELVFDLKYDSGIMIFR